MVILDSENTQYEPKVADFCRRLGGKLFVDVGANVGFYPRLLQKNFSRMVAIEADPAIFEYLRKRCPANCRALNAAVADRGGVARLYRNPENLFGGATVMSDLGIEVPRVSLDAILDNESLIDLIKVDVEGAEWLVLKGAENIMPHVKRWVIELHDRRREAELQEYMRQHGYECIWLDHGHFPHAYFERLKAD